MTARSPSCEELARLPCVHADDRRDPRYIGDAVIRAYRHLGMRQLLIDLGWPADTPAVRIAGGIGNLLLSAHNDAGTFVASERPNTAEILTPVSPAVAAQREHVCFACTYYQPNVDRCALCGCGWVVRDRARSPVAHCPDQRWV